MSLPRGPFDLAVIGAGIVGLAAAYAAARLGKRVIVLERDTRANGASIRNFGFITVTGQPAGECWRRARRSRDLWADVAEAAGIAVEHSGLLLTARRAESRAVIEAFLATLEGRDCAWLEPADVRARFPALSLPGLGALYSPHEIRVESREAIPKLAAWLEARFSVQFAYSTAAHAITPSGVQTARGAVEAEAVVVCPGDDFATLYPEALSPLDLTRCRLSMLRLAAPGFSLPTGVMSDLGLVRYGGYSSLPEAKALEALLQAEQPAHLAHGVHLIVVQSADGSLVVGDSHHYHPTPAPFASSEVEALILQEFEAALGSAPPPVLERWTGVYASSASRTASILTPEPNVRLVVVTSGTGASTAFALGEEAVGDLYGVEQGAWIR